MGRQGQNTVASQGQIRFPVFESKGRIELRHQSDQKRKVGSLAVHRCGDPCENRNAFGGLGVDERDIFRLGVRGDNPIERDRVGDDLTNQIQQPGSVAARVVRREDQGRDFGEGPAKVFTAGLLSIGLMSSRGEQLLPRLVTRERFCRILLVKGKCARSLVFGNSAPSTRMRVATASGRRALRANERGDRSTCSECCAKLADRPVVRGRQKLDGTHHGCTHLGSLHSRVFQSRGVPGKRPIKAICSLP